MQEQIKENEETGQNGQEESPKKQFRKKKQRSLSLVMQQQTAWKGTTLNQKRLPQWRDGI